MDELQGLCDICGFDIVVKIGLSRKDEFGRNATCKIYAPDADVIMAYSHTTDAETAVRRAVKEFINENNI